MLAELTRALRCDAVELGPARRTLSVRALPTEAAFHKGIRQGMRLDDFLLTWSLARKSYITLSY